MPVLTGYCVYGDMTQSGKSESSGERGKGESAIWETANRARPAPAPGWHVARQHTAVRPTVQQLSLSVGQPIKAKRWEWCQPVPDERKKVFQRFLQTKRRLLSFAGSAFCGRGGKTRGSTLLRVSGISTLE